MVLAINIIKMNEIKVLLSCFSTLNSKKAA